MHVLTTSYHTCHLLCSATGDVVKVVYVIYQTSGCCKLIATQYIGALYNVIINRAANRLGLWLVNIRAGTVEHVMAIGYDLGVVTGYGGLAMHHWDSLEHHLPNHFKTHGFALICACVTGPHTYTNFQV